MATHAHSTRTPLLPQAGAQSALLPCEAGRQIGPVTAAIRAMRVAHLEPEPNPRSRVMRRAWALFRLDRVPGFAAALAEAWREKRTQTAAAFCSVQPLRALLAYSELPSGCIAHPVTEDGLAPHLRPGEFAIIDPADRDPIRGELFLVAWTGVSERDGTERLALVQAFQRDHECGGQPFTAWWVGSMRNRLSPEKTKRLVAERRWDRLGWSNGPYRDGALERQLRGRVVGVLASNFEEPKRIGAGAGL